MAKSIIFVDSSQNFDVFQKYVQDSTQLVNISDIFGEGSAEYLRRLYSNDLAALLQNSSLKLQSYKQLADESANLSFAMCPDFTGDAVAAVLTDMFQATKKAQRLCLSSISAKAFRSGIQQKNGVSGDLGILEKAVALDKVFDAHARHILQIDNPALPVFGLAAAFTLGMICRVDHEERDADQNSISISGIFQCKGQPIEAMLVKVNSRPAQIGNKHIAKAMLIDLKEQHFTINSIRSKQIVKSPPPPFNTTKLIAAAEQYLGFEAKKTLAVARSLYAGCDIGLKSPAGLITFPVSDSLFVPEDDLLAIRESILVNYGKEYLPDTASVFTEQKGTRIGAIRPALFSKPPQKVKKYLNEDQFHLYSLIWNRTLASQMVQATFENQQVLLSGGPKKRYIFRMEDNHVIRRGYLQLYPNATHSSALPVFDDSDKGARVQTVEFKLTHKAAHKAFYYTEGRLFDALGDLDICLLETLEYVLETLNQWNFIHSTGGEIMATPLGRKANRIISAACPDILNRTYLRQLKKKLLKSGKQGKKQIDLAVELQKLLENRSQQLQRTETGTERPQKCPVCSGAMVINENDSGRYLACEHYPDKCHYMKSIDVHTHRYYGRCALCDSEMIVKVGRYGRFLACSRFPKCKFTKPFPIDVKCPKAGCDGQVIERITSKGQLFYGCSAYPKCSFSSWQKPVNIACPGCGNSYLVEKISDDENIYSCPKCKAQLNMNTDEKQEDHASS